MSQRELSINLSSDTHERQQLASRPQLLDA